MRRVQTSVICTRSARYLYSRKHAELDNNGKYLSYEEFKTKYDIEANFICYCQILFAIPKSLLKLKAMTIKKNLQRQS